MKKAKSQSFVKTITIIKQKWNDNSAKYMEKFNAFGQDN